MTRQLKREPRFRKRRKAPRNFIPDGDCAFAFMARTFARTIAAEPERYMLGASDAQVILEVVQAYRDALARSLPKMTRTRQLVMRKDAARQKAERMIRRCARLIRANDTISAEDKEAIFIRERPSRLKRRMCPMVPPFLLFVGAMPGGQAHILEFMNELGGGKRAKPFGAVRVELFAELIEPGAPIPMQPGEGARYVRSFSKNPIVTAFPAMNGKPMKVVYWARWADARGEVGPWSKPAAARLEIG